MVMSEFRKVSKYRSFPKSPEKAIETLKEQGKMPRVEFWNLIGSESVGDTILFMLYNEKKVKLEFEEKIGWVAYWLEKK